MVFFSPRSGPVSGSLAVVTPSYGPDLELCKDLNRSVLAMTAVDVVHHIVVPRNDRGDFENLAGPRTQIHDAREYLPRTFVHIPWLNMWINATRPWPPIRGWIYQQIIKLAVCASLDTDGVLLLDSDSVLVRPTTLDAFSVEGEVCMYRKPRGVDHTLPGHRQWHISGRKLLGFQTPPADGDLTDYICWPCLWEPRVVRDLLLHIERATGLAWPTAVGSQLHFSEMMLYGIFVDEVLGGKRASTTMQGTVHSAEAALSGTEIQELLRSGPQDALAVMLSAKAHIPLETRRRELKEFTDYIDKTDRTSQP
ncbi:DUF6492 family protein [Paenarthrobacter nitroguajacolicus]|uniref:DUF6492 family protein n=1 Tax=Paenarthrobacter nitroguajacolicus TaxID=211146 RepID=UPI003AE5A54D